MITFIITLNHINLYILYMLSQGIVLHIIEKNSKTIIFDKGSINFQRNALFSFKYTKSSG